MSGLLSLTAADAGVDTTVSLLNRLFPAPRLFAVRLWEGTELFAPASACLVFKHPGALRRMLTPPIELSLSEAFIYGDFDIEGDIFALFPVLDAAKHRFFSFFEIAGLTRQTLSLPRSGPERRVKRGPARLRGRTHSRARDRAAIQYHYDVGNNFYELWLDRYMQYSCAYFDSDAEDLNTAQTRKLEHICRKLRLKSGERLLDIGCGWGGLAQYAAQHHGVRVLGITVSQKQAAYANARIARAGLGDRASAKLLDYRDVSAESFDKIVSVGMFEYVGQKQLPEYFAQAYRALKPGGLFLNHGISRRAPWLHRINSEVDLCCMPDMRPARVSLWQQWVEQYFLGQGRFIQRYVFPDGEVLPVSQVNVVAEQAGFEVRDVENLREHYALTLRHWVDRLETRRTEAIDLVGEAVYRTWRLYMAVSAYGFNCGRININQTLLAKPDAGRSHLPLTREDLYA